MTLEALQELLSCTPQAWTAEKQVMLADGVRELLGQQRTITFTTPCTDEVAVVYWRAMLQRVHARIADVMHTGGAHWTKTELQWNFSRLPVSGEENFTRFADFQSSMTGLGAPAAQEPAPPAAPRRKPQVLP